MRWSRQQGWSHIPGTQAALPNGIAVAKDNGTFYYADAGNSQVVIMSVATGKELRRVRVGGAPNNLTVTASGKVLATGATLSGDLPVLCGFGGRRCRTGWGVWEIDAANGSVAEIVAESGKYISNATTALEIGDTLYIGSMDDTRVGLYRRP